MAVFVVWLIRQRSSVAGHLQVLSMTYPAVLGWLTVALGVWLLFRLRWVPPTLIEWIVLIDVLAVVHPYTLLMDRTDQPFSWWWIVCPLMLVVTHLAVEPLRPKTKDESQRDSVS